MQVFKGGSGLFELVELGILKYILNSVITKKFLSVPLRLSSLLSISICKIFCGAFRLEQIDHCECSDGQADGNGEPSCYTA